MRFRTALHSAPLLAAALLYAGPLSAQSISLEVSPNPIPPGSSALITGTDATGGGLALPSGCGWLSIHQGSPTGPEIGFPGGCGAAIIDVAANGSFGYTWFGLDENGVPLPDGEYWLESFVYSPDFSTVHTDWFCVSVQAPDQPTLSTSGAPQVGQALALDLSAPAFAGTPYIAGASFSSNAPIAIPGLGQLCLSADNLFWASYPAPVAGVFQNFQGALDASGQASLSLQLPGFPPLAYQALQLQAVLIAPTGFVKTNALTLSIRP